jgi:hypothetical protein
MALMKINVIWDNEYLYYYYLYCYCNYNNNNNDNNKNSILSFSVSTVDKAKHRQENMKHHLSLSLISKENVLINSVNRTWQCKFTHDNF